MLSQSSFWVLQRIFYVCLLSPDSTRRLTWGSPSTVSSRSWFLVRPLLKYIKCASTTAGHLFPRLCLLYGRIGTCAIVIAVRSTHVVLHFIEDRSRRPWCFILLVILEDRSARHVNDRPRVVVAIRSSTLLHIFQDNFIFSSGSQLIRLRWMFLWFLVRFRWVYSPPL